MKKTRNGDEEEEMEGHHDEPSTTWNLAGSCIWRNRLNSRSSLDYSMVIWHETWSLLNGVRSTSFFPPPPPISHPTAIIISLYTQLQDDEAFKVADAGGSGVACVCRSLHAIGIIAMLSYCYQPLIAHYDSI